MKLSHSRKYRRAYCYVNDDMMASVDARAQWYGISRASFMRRCVAHYLALPPNHLGSPIRRPRAARQDRALRLVED